jgi:hypothetical protein
MADRGHADADQVVDRLLRQHFAVDIVVAEGGAYCSSPSPRSHAAMSIRRVGERSCGRQNTSYTLLARPDEGACVLP